MTDKIQEPNYKAKVVRAWRDENEGCTLDDAIGNFHMGISGDDDEIVECDDGRYYRILATVIVDEITKDEADLETNWDLDDEEVEVSQ